MIRPVVTNDASIVTTGKSLSVNLMLDGRPKFDFFGKWTGKDITLVSGLLSRAYHKHKLAEKHATIKKEE